MLPPYLTFYSSSVLLSLLSVSRILMRSLCSGPACASNHLCWNLGFHLPPLKHVTLMPLFAIPMSNSLSLHFLSAFTPCMHGGCYFLAQCKGLWIYTSSPPNTIVFSTTWHCDALPCIGWIFFLSKEILLQLFISYVTVLPSFGEQWLQFSYLTYFLGPLFALGQIHLLVQHLCYSAFLWDPKT